MRYRYLYHRASLRASSSIVIVHRRIAVREALSRKLRSPLRTCSVRVECRPEYDRNDRKPLRAVRHARFGFPDDDPCDDRDY